MKIKNKIQILIWVVERIPFPLPPHLPPLKALINSPFKNFEKKNSITKMSAAGNDVNY